MLENTESLLPYQSGKKPKAITCGFESESLDELDRLLATLGVESAARILAPNALKKINPATYIGEGKVAEVKTALEEHQAELVVLDVELSPNQLRNLEKAIGKAILDRPGVIIEIFSRHARTNESKTQVAIARLQYLMPRLTHFWTHFERQGGGGKGSRGMGQKQIDVDRSLVKKRIDIMKNRLKQIEKERKVQRHSRKDVMKVALVGYTNAGKSTLLNALTQSKVLAEDKLFATLDASVRSLDPNCHPPVVAIDTVGFISNLPPTLVASFRSTLEELREADLLLHVVDASSAGAKEQMETVEKILEELEVDKKPRMVVLNKADLLGGQINRARIVSPGAMRISALNPDDAKRLRDAILEHFRKSMDVYEILVPYSESKLEARLHEYGSIETSRHMEKGTFYRLRMDLPHAERLQLKKYQI